MDKVEKYLKENSLLELNYSKYKKAGVWIQGKRKYYGDIIGHYGDGIRFKDEKTGQEIELEMK